MHCSEHQLHKGNLTKGNKKDIPLLKIPKHLVQLEEIALTSSILFWKENNFLTKNWIFFSLCKFY